MLPPPRFTIGKVLANGWAVPGFFQTWRLGFRSKSSIFVSIDQRMSFLMVWESFSCLFGKPQVCSFISLVYHTGLIGGVLQNWLYFWKVLLSSQSNTGALLLITSLIPSTSVAQMTSCRKSPICFKLLWFTDDEGNCGLWNLQFCIGFLYPCPLNLFLDTILSWRSTDNSLDFMSWVVLWYRLSAMGGHIDRYRPFQTMSNQLSF